MPNFDWTALVGQLGASAIFAAALVVVVRAFYNHLLDDQKVMRDRISYLEAKLDKLEERVTSIR
jgi:hypothetical protein